MPKWEAYLNEDTSHIWWLGKLVDLRIVQGTHCKAWEDIIEEILERLAYPSKILM